MVVLRFHKLIVVLAFLFLTAFYLFSYRKDTIFVTKASANMTITHIVLFKFKPNASTKRINELSSRFLALEHECLSAATQKPYIISVKGGTDNSSEGAQNGITHAFVVEFETAADRDYYVNVDPVHGDFKNLAGEILEKAIVVDFATGVFV